jgi:hypothetical protein
MIGDDKLTRRQSVLQAQARRVLEQLQLMEHLGRAGTPIVVGSMALGLMVWPDIDVEIHCAAVSADLAFETVRPLASIPGVFKLSYRDWSGQRSSAYLPDGYYWGVRYRAEDTVWKLDLWFVSAETTPPRGSAALESLPPRLTPEARHIILRLKSLWFEHPSYRHEIYSTDIYDAVLEHGVVTAEQFERYLRARGKLP